MNDQHDVHPPRDTLAAYGLGKLEPGTAASIEAHIAECDACCETLLDLQCDTFVDLVRRADAVELELEAGEIQASAATSAFPDVAPATTFDLPQELADHPRYRILELLGRGGMGDVYKAEHRLMNRPVALKVINQKLVQNPQAVERFRREVQAAAQLAHPNIVTAHDAEQAGTVHYLVMEYVEGIDLSDVVKESGPLPVDTACDYIRQAAMGLQHAYEKGMVHRDIKPHNLMVTGEGQVKILDFGLATLATLATDDFSEMDGTTSADDNPGSTPSPRLTTIGTMMGTPDFISPEQAGDAHCVDTRSDIYSLGCTFYYLLTGRPPFEESSAMDKVKAHREREPASVKTVRIDVPGEVADTVRRMMAKDPAERFQTPAEIVDALAPFVDRHPASAALEPVQAAPTAGRAFKPVPKRMAQRSSRTPAWLVASALLLPLSIAAGVILYLATDTGHLEIINDTPAVPGAKIVLTKGGKEYATFALQPGAKTQTIRAGEYNVSLRGAPADVDLSVWTKRGDANDWGMPDDHVKEPVVVYRGGGLMIEVTRLLSRAERMEHAAPAAVRGHFPANGRAVLYAIYNDGKLVRINVGANGFQATVVSDLGTAFRDVEGLEMGADGMLLAAVHGANDVSHLHTIDINTGTASEVGPMGFAEVDGLAWQDGELFAVTSRFGGQSAQLLSVDLSTGRAEAIGKPLPLDDLDSLTFDHRGRLLTTDGMGIHDKFYQLNPTAAAAPKALAPTPPIIENSRDIEGLTLGADGKLYGVTHPNPLGEGPNRSHLVRIDPETFEYVDLGLLDFGTFCIAGDLWPPALPKALPAIIQARSLGMTLRLIPAGSFDMGTAEDDVNRLMPDEDWFFARFVPSRRRTETPQHRVTLTKPFYMAAHEVTVAQFRQFIDATGYRTTAEREGNRYGWPNGVWRIREEFDWTNPGFEQRDDHPVCNVSWGDAIAFCRWLSEVEGATYRLPTEAEWEYACRAGTTTLFSTGDEPDSLRGAANLADASLRQAEPSVEWAVDWDDGYVATAPVGSFEPNALGLYDMHGNVWEGCTDIYDEDYYRRTPAVDPVNGGSFGTGVFRGGGFDNWPGFLRSADRYSSHSPSLRTEWAGFRVVREIEAEGADELTEAPPSHLPAAE